MAILFDDSGMLLGDKAAVLDHMRLAVRPGYMCTVLPDPTLPAAAGYHTDPPVPGARRLVRVDPGTAQWLGDHQLCPVEELFRLNLTATLIFATERDLPRLLRRRLRLPPRDQPEDGTE